MIKFGQVYLSKPVFIEKDGSAEALLPHMARLRNLTYSAPLFVDIKHTIFEADPNHPYNKGVVNVSEMHLVQ